MSDQAPSRPTTAVRPPATRPVTLSEERMMATMTMEQILERVKGLKQESAEKDETIRDQQMQIDELERKLKSVEDRCAELRQQVDDLTGTAAKAEEILDKLSDMLS
jgi:septal ring factor EnvC (AmiA/AmiB activator)